jgi:hypothetical protein
VCSFLTVGVEAARSASLERQLEAARLEVSRAVNPQVARLFPSGDVLFLVTHGGCSCDLRPATKHSSREEKLRRRGLTGAKLARALEAQKTPRPGHAEAFFSSLQASAPLRLFFHEVSGDPLTEPVNEAARVTTLP